MQRFPLAAWEQSRSRVAARRLLDHDALLRWIWRAPRSICFCTLRSGVMAQLFARPAARSELIRRVRSSFGPNRDLQFTLTNIRLKDIFREASNTSVATGQVASARLARCTHSQACHRSFHVSARVGCLTQLSLGSSSFFSAGDHGTLCRRDWWHSPLLHHAARRR
jgi:hypothetical protein